MKFGSQLKNAIYPEWQSHYIDYDGLKKKLRKAEKDRPFTEKDETEFVEVLDANLEKVRRAFERVSFLGGENKLVFIYMVSGVCVPSTKA